MTRRLLRSEDLLGLALCLGRDPGNSYRKQTKNQMRCNTEMSDGNCALMLRIHLDVETCLLPAKGFQSHYALN